MSKMIDAQKSLPDNPIYYKKGRDLYFKCSESGCGRSQKKRKSEDEFFSARYNTCRRNDVPKNRHGSILYKCAICDKKKEKRLMSYVGYGDGICLVCSKH